MARNRVRLNSRGIQSVLTSTLMHRAVQGVAESVADNVKAMDIRVGDRDGGSHERELPVDVSVTTTDRAHARVTITHPAGAAVQAKHGALTKAAGQAGLDVRGEA